MTIVAVQVVIIKYRTWLNQLSILSMMMMMMIVVTMNLTRAMMVILHAIQKLPKIAFKLLTFLTFLLWLIIVFPQSKKREENVPGMNYKYHILKRTKTFSEKKH